MESKHNFFQKKTFCTAAPTNLRGFRPNFPSASRRGEEFFGVKLFWFAQNIQQNKTAVASRKIPKILRNALRK